MKKEFDEFWGLCIRKRSKGRARKAYEKALTIASHEEICDGMSRSVAHWRSCGTLEQYIPHPATWLNGECWEDDYSSNQEPSVFDLLFDEENIDSKLH